MGVSADEKRLLVDGNAGFVRSIAAKVKQSLPSQIEFDDLVAYGTQGLLEAADRFDPKHGVAFSTFAYYRIRGAIYDGLRRMGSLPRNIYKQVRAEERTTQYMQSRAESANEETGSDSTEAALNEVSEALSGAAAIYLTSLDADNLIERVPAELPEVEQEKREETRLFQRALATLPEKERRLLELYYYEDRSLEEAGKTLGLSKSWASRLHARAILLVRDALEKFDAI